jgi:hypothetical protein
MAGGQRKEGDIDSADNAVDKTLFALQERYYFAQLLYHRLPCLSTGAVPSIYKTELIMTGRDDIEVRNMNLPLSFQRQITTVWQLSGID